MEDYVSIKSTSHYRDMKVPLISNFKPYMSNKHRTLIVPWIWEYQIMYYLLYTRNDNIMTWERFPHLRARDLRPRQNGRHFADDTFKRILLKENVRISIKFSLKFVPKSPIDNVPTLFQIMAWRLPADKPLSEAMTVSLLAHICVARPQWVIQMAGELGHHDAHVMSL